jgi:DNA gyrase/topoisomerase IV subunit B
VSKEVTAAVTRLLENHREQEKALLQAALQAAQQALQQAAERAAEQKAETEQLKAEIIVRAGCKGKVAPCQGTLVRSRWEGGTFDAHVCHLDVGPPART